MPVVKKAPAKKKTTAVKAKPAKAAPAKKKTATAKPAKPVKTKVAPKKEKETAKKVVTKKAVVKKAKPAAETSDISTNLRDVVLRILDERQAEDIVTVDLRTRSAIADFAIVASGRSSRQLVAIAEYLREAFFKNGIKKIRVEGLEQADWILFDGGDVIVHLFRPEVREYYKLEDIWASRPTNA